MSPSEPTRMCGSDEFIATQIEYNRRIRAHGNQFQFHADNTGMRVEETAREVAEYAKAILPASKH